MPPRRTKSTIDLVDRPLPKARDPTLGGVRAIVGSFETSFPEGTAEELFANALRTPRGLRNADLARHAVQLFNWSGGVSYPPPVSSLLDQWNLCVWEDFNKIFRLLTTNQQPRSLYPYGVIERRVQKIDSEFIRLLLLNTCTILALAGEQRLGLATVEIMYWWVRVLDHLEKDEALRVCTSAKSYLEKILDDGVLHDAASAAFVQSVIDRLLTYTVLVRLEGPIREPQGRARAVPLFQPTSSTTPALDHFRTYWRPLIAQGLVGLEEIKGRDPYLVSLLDAELKAKDLAIEDVAPPRAPSIDVLARHAEAQIHERNLTDEQRAMARQLRVALGLSSSSSAEPKSRPGADPGRPLWSERAKHLVDGQVPDALQWFDAHWREGVEAGEVYGDTIIAVDAPFYRAFASALHRRKMKLSDILPKSPTRGRLGESEEERARLKRAKNAQRMRRYRARKPNPSGSAPS